MTRFALSRINRMEERPFIFYLRPWEVDPEQPRIHAGWLSTFRHYTNLSRCESRLRRLLRDFRFVPAGGAGNVAHGEDRYRGVSLAEAA